MKDGTRLQGTLIEARNDGGVTVKLSDGSVRKVGGEDLAYAGSAQHGALNVTAEVPGLITVDRGIAGHTPLRLQGLSPGIHHLAIDYDEGGWSRARVMVQPGDTATYHFERLVRWRAAAARKGLHFASAAALHIAWGDLDSQKASWGSEWHEAYPHPGGELQYGINYGLTRVLDLRAMGFLGTGGRDLITVGVLGAMRLNWGSVYSFELGVRLGYHKLEDRKLAFMPTVSPFSFRVGPRRNYEITPSLATSVTSYAMLVGLAVSHLYLD